MYRTLITLSIFLAFLLPNINGQGIDFFEGSFEEAVDKAQKEEKLVFVDAYATWCGPCKKMSKTVFPDEKVGDFFNQNFISLKLDMEKPLGRSFGKKFPVTAYPTLFFINEKGELLKKVVGGKSAKDFLKIGQTIVQSYDRSGDLADLYNSGNRDFDIVLKYVRALNNANKSSLKVANDYLREKKDLSEKQMAQFTFEALTASDSRIFDLYIQQRTQIEELFGKDVSDQKIEEACWKTIENAIAFDSDVLLYEAKNKMKSNLANRHQDFAYNANYEFAKATANVALLNEAAMELSNYLNDTESERLHDICNELIQYKNLDPAIIDASERIAKRASELNPTAEYLMTYASILSENNKNKKAIKSAKQALEATSNPREILMIKEWLDTLKSE